MTVFQLDQSLNSRRFADSCNAAGLAEVYRFPNALKNAKDPEMIKALFPRGNPLVTLDRTIAVDHTECIPNSHPGIIIVCNPSEAKTITSNVATDIIDNFKHLFNIWNLVSWRNVICEISHQYIEFFGINSGKVVSRKFILFSDDDWIESVREILR